jgi:hypothetical protein
MQTNVGSSTSPLMTSPRPLRARSTPLALLGSWCKFQEENPIADLEIEIETDGIVVTINIVTVLASAQRNFKDKITEIYLNPRTQHACEGPPSRDEP